MCFRFLINFVPFFRSHTLCVMLVTTPWSYFHAPMIAKHVVRWKLDRHIQTHATFYFNKDKNSHQNEKKMFNFCYSILDQDKYSKL